MENPKMEKTNEKKFFHFLRLMHRKIHFCNIYNKKSKYFLKKLENKSGKRARKFSLLTHKTTSWRCYYHMSSTVKYRAKNVSTEK